MAEELNYSIYEIFEIVISILMVLITITGLFYVKSEETKEVLLIGKEISYLSGVLYSDSEVRVVFPKNYLDDFIIGSGGKFEISSLKFELIDKNVILKKENGEIVLS